MTSLRFSRVPSCLPLAFLAFASAHCQQSAPPADDVASGGSSGGKPPVVQPIAGSGGSAPAVAMGGSATTTVGGMSTGGSGGSEPMEPRGPTPAANGVNFPFPQNRFSSNCSYPKFRNADVKAAYDKWKADTVTGDGAGGFLRVKRPKDPGLEDNSTVSEGIAYGMLIAVYMGDQSLFDSLWKYEQLWLDKNGLMDWYISGNGKDRLGEGAATDADEDMAWALLMADKQWGGKGGLNDSYFNIAKHQIEQVYNTEIQDDKLIKPGDTWGGWSTVNPSYFAPSYYRAFAKASGNNKWNDVLQTSYDTLAKSLNSQNGNADNGLVPAWCTSDGAPNPNVWMGKTAPTHYQYDSCRTPFRIGLDFCQNAEQRAQSYVAKTSQFFSNIGAKQMVDGYDLNGNPRPEFSGGQSAAFLGPAAVGAMSSATYSTFLQDGYDSVATLNLLIGGTYYDESWTVISLLMMSGNFLDYTALTPS
ncbi:MAG TPA: glycosyl hydrolase family 8 [Polyangiaceae bacterium]|nr:glycosyl hydrolase family 8 [Polyangiaceae bacterium]